MTTAFLQAGFLPTDCNQPVFLCAYSYLEFAVEFTERENHAGSFHPQQRGEGKGREPEHPSGAQQDSELYPSGDTVVWHGGDGGVYFWIP